MEPNGQTRGTCIYPPQNLAGYPLIRSMAESAEAVSLLRIHPKALAVVFPACRQAGAKADKLI